MEIERLKRYIKTYIIEEPEMRENDMNAIRRRISVTFENRQFREKMKQSERLHGTNLLQIEQTEVLRIVKDFLESIDL